MVDFCATIPSENQRKTHRFNVIRQIIYINENKKEDFHYILNYGYIKWYLY